MSTERTAHWLRRLARSWTTHLVYWYVVKPAVFTAIFWLVIPATFRTAWAIVGTFLAVNVVLNSRTGQAVGEAVFQGLVHFMQLLGSGLLTGLVHGILRLFKRVTEMVEYVLFSVDEWLRFRRGDSRVALVVRMVLGVLWFPVSYLVRFYMVVLIEPGINSVRISIKIKQADEIEHILVHKFTRFLTQRAESFFVLRRKPIKVWLCGIDRQWPLPSSGNRECEG